MDIKLELLSKTICYKILKNFDNLNLDINQIAQTNAISAISEIKKVIQNNDLSDFDIVEEIVVIFEKYHIDCGACHDFG